MHLESDVASNNRFGRSCALLIGVVLLGVGVFACWDRSGRSTGLSSEAAVPKRDGRAQAADSGGRLEVSASDSPADVSFSIHGRRAVKDISPFIYGVNTHCSWEGAVARPGMVRLGGNRWTTYNWTNNASNAGSDYHHQNDAWLGGGNSAGEAVRSRVSAAHEAGAAALVTIPIVEHVAADKRRGGDVAQSGRRYLEQRFVPSVARKGEPFEYPPSSNSERVYQDEMIAWLEDECSCPRDEKPIFYALDNEPCLWASTHPRIRPEPVSYRELTERSIEYAGAIKSVAPDSLVFGPVSYGWMGFTNLQNAPDADGRDFLDVYLRDMRVAAEEHDRRLLDVLTIHWYPEARGGGQRITGGDDSQAVVEARVQAPRSLWDPTYTEDSWIARRVLGGPIRLLPRLRDKIDAAYPGTRLAITEYNYGGGGHISGGVAQADVLGILGREGVFAASVWTFGQGPSDYLFGAMNMFLDYDGEGSSFGDTSIHARTTDPARTSVYASHDSRDPAGMTVVAINKSQEEIVADIRITRDAVLEGGRVFRIEEGSASPRNVGAIAPQGDNAFKLPLPSMSVTTLELR